MVWNRAQDRIHGMCHDKGGMQGNVFKDLEGVPSGEFLTGGVTKGGCASFYLWATEEVLAKLYYSGDNNEPLGWQT